MKRIVRLVESDLVKIIERVVQEGKTDRGVKEKDIDVKIDTFQTSIKNHLNSKDDVKVKKVGDDFEIHSDGDHVGQVMFRKEGITVKKVGSKFGKKFGFNELGNIKKEINRILKEDFSVEPDVRMIPREKELQGVFGKYSSEVPDDVLRYMRKNPKRVIDRLINLYGEDKFIQYVEDSLTKKQR
jgi:nucleoid DNA-binding protein